MNEVIEKFQHLLAPQPLSYEKKKDYKMGYVIGQGSFGIVRRAIHRESKQEVAVKVILKKIMKSRMELVFRELEANKLLKHKGVVPFREWFESKDKFYLVFGLCQGGELFERLARRGKFSERDAIPLIFQLVEAVAYLHECGVVHRDIKPENLLFETEAEDSRLMLTDFGISNVLEKEEDLLSTVCGSRGYVAPEVILRQKYGKPVDMWAIGIIAFLL
ncbi:Calmodulin-dependent protein kinase cmk2 [Entomophthora muscae]|uniref:Calmodulin-dependent protein kinase cmk2 n=1 Tax=Entomophthora muscae TaxID=34485 RepID=A0ACC2T035_9FUNG|nr:Calmodulin-dependent protein kinase cmk2 [Entomophthora muscae]